MVSKIEIWVKVEWELSQNWVRVRNVFAWNLWRFSWWACEWVWGCPNVWMFPMTSLIAHGANISPSPWLTCFYILYKRPSPTLFLFLFLIHHNPPLFIVFLVFLHSSYVLFFLWLLYQVPHRRSSFSNWYVHTCMKSKSSSIDPYSFSSTYKGLCPGVWFRHS